MRTGRRTAGSKGKDRMKQLHQKEKENLTRILTQNGQSRSEDLVKVLDAFLEAENHQSAQDVHQRLKAGGQDLGPEFVQEALDIFCHYGFASSKIFNGWGKRYEHKHLGEHHDHLICTRCGRVEEFINPLIEDLQDNAAREKGFVPFNHRMDIYGLCRKCTEARGYEVPLSEAGVGEKVVVCGHCGGEELQRRLTDMGIGPGVEVEVLGSNRGPVVVACRGSRLALGRGMCEKVLVQSAKPSIPRPCGFRHGWRRMFRKH